ncbi:MAG: alanine--tRNA ligase-related protein, partial [Spirochaetota bacterium]
MPTKKLFEEDSYKKEFTSTINRFEGNKIILNQTVFYANSGGQPGDTGVLRLDDIEMKVIDTVKGDNKEIVHILDKDYELDKHIEKPLNEVEIYGKIDWDRRYAHMKNHTALHILNYYILRDTGAMVTGGQVGPDKSRMDFNTEGMDKEHMQSIIDECNKLIEEGRKVN